jgi:hypothetical protein
MSFLSTEFEGSIGEVYLNGDVSSANNPVANALGITTSITSSVWLSLHDGFPGETGANEVDTTKYPGYARSGVVRNPTSGPGGAAPWTKVNSNGMYFRNAASIQWPPCGSGGTSPVCTHWGMWDSVTGGRLMTYGP